MRNVLTFIAVALVTFLTVALVAPPMIDWSARRELVARSIAARIGEPVRLGGAVTLRLLPTPYLRLADVAIGPSAHPWLQAKAMRLEFSFLSLFGGRMELDDLSFDTPMLRLGPRFAPPERAAFGLGHIGAVHADIGIERADAPPIVLHDLSFQGSAASARGPYRGEGDFALGQGRAHYAFAAEGFAGPALPFKGEIDAEDRRADLDGRLIVGETPAFTGTATLAGRTMAPDGAAWPWRIAGTLAAIGVEARMDYASVRLGEDARALEADGALIVSFGAATAIAADLKTRTLNLDAALRRDKQTFVPPARAAQAFAGLGARWLGGQGPGASLALKLKAEVAYVGARALEEPALNISGAGGGPLTLKWQSGLPGHGRVALDGTLDLGAAPVFRGKGQGAVGDYGALVSWLAEGDRDLATRLTSLGAALPQGALRLNGAIEASPQGVALREMTLGAGESHFDGTLVYDQPGANTRGKLYLDLTTPALDVETAPNVAAGIDWLGESDLDFRLAADRLRVARVGLASVSGGSLSVRALKEGQKFALENLSIADLDGASVQAQGETSPSGRWVRVKLDARKLGDVAALVARTAPGPAAQWFVRRAADLGAARATFEARRDGPPLAGPFPLDFLRANGEVAGARFSLDLSRAPAPVDAISAQASLDSLDAGSLLRKFGLPVAPAAAGRGQLTLTGSGQWETGFAAHAKLALAGADLDWSGTFAPKSDGPVLSGPLNLKAADALPALAALGLAPASANLKAPLDLSADLAAQFDGAHLGHLAGTLAGARVGGDLDWRRAPETADAEAAAAPVTGALSLDRVSLGGLLSLTLGPLEPARSGALWSEAKFGPAPVLPPGVDVALKVDALDFGAGTARTLSGRLGWGRDRLALADGAALVNGGQFGFHFDLRRSPAQATATGGLTAADVGLDRAGLSGRIDANLDFVGSGPSPAALVASLAGAGQVKLREAKFPKLDPEGLTRAFARIEQTQGPPPDERKLETLIGAELDKGPLTLADSEGPLALTSGALRFGPLYAGAGASVSGALRLADLSLGLQATETGARTGRYWSGPPPAVEIEQKSGTEAPARRIDVSMLSAGLASEAIARESDRIENFEADVRERAMFNRARKAWLFLDRREAEIAAYLDAIERRRLMGLYLAPYRQWAESHEDATPTPPTPPSRSSAGL